MRLGLWLVLLFVSFLASAYAEEVTSKCAKLKSSDEELNRVYNAVSNKHKGDQAFLKKFKSAQKAWLMFRDAHRESIFPAEDKALTYGSSYTDCACGVLLELTEQRVVQLSRWIEGVPEGDVCTGSIGLKN